MEDFFIRLMYFSSLTNDWNYVVLDENHALLHWLKNSNNKTQKNNNILEAVFKYLALFKMLHNSFQDVMNSIFLANNFHIYSNACCLFAFYVTLKNDCLPCVLFYSSYLWHGQTQNPLEGSKVESFVIKVNSWKSLVLLESAQSFIYIYIYIYIDIQTDRQIDRQIYIE